MINLSINTYVFIGFGLLLLGVIIWLIVTEIRIRKFFRGAKARDLEATFSSIVKDIEKIHDNKAEMDKYLVNLEKRVQNSFQNFYTLRFNPFEDAGSNQSFATAILNEHGDGVVFSGLYSRERVNVYAKPLKKFQSEFTLSEEEKTAIERSKNNG